MLTVSPKVRENPPEGGGDVRKPADKPRYSVSALFSGLSPRLKGALMVLQAWFDESGKGQEGVYLLAGYSASESVWRAFEADWQTELDREPRLLYLHARERQLFKGLSPQQRDDRLLKFVGIIQKHKLDGTILPLKHSDHREFYRIAATHPAITDPERRMLKNPYAFAFQWTLGVMLSKQAKKRRDSGVTELIEVLFDEDIDRKERLKIGFRRFIESVKSKTPDFLDLLVNKEPEFRDDKDFLPLQASDLLAWYVRRLCYEGARGNKWTDPVWLALKEATHLEIFPYTAERYADTLLRIRDETRRLLGF